MSHAGENDSSVVTRTAKLNVAAACLLIAVKLVAAAATGSLGILAEAAHSATDLVAALLTLYAVRVAVRPPDSEHHYGHGKAEHLAALAEAAFLLLVSVAIGYESIHRLVSGDAGSIDPRWWAFLVFGVVIALDISRAVGSRRIARRYESPALAANALHFASDLAGSVAVLIGLAFVAAGITQADAIAALFVATLVFVAAVRLVSQSVDVLMDRASADADTQIRKALDGLRGVELRRARVRHAAGRSFVDLVVGVSPDAGVTQAHATADEIERRVEQALASADVVVHVEPMTAEGSLRERATVAASQVPEAREIHNVRLLDVDGERELSLHVKLPRDLSLTDAHDVTTRLEAAVRADVPEISRVHTHIEPLSPTREASKPRDAEVEADRAQIQKIVLSLTGALPEAIDFREAPSGRIALVTITVAGDVTLPDAHQLAGEIEAAITQRCPHLNETIIHTEPRHAPG